MSPAANAATLPVRMLSELAVSDCIPVGTAVGERADETLTHVPDVPATVQTNILPVWSMQKSPTLNVPDAGAPDAVAPTNRAPDVAPVRPVDAKPGDVSTPMFCIGAT